MATQTEINRGYVNYLRVINAPAAETDSAAPAPSPPRPPRLKRLATWLGMQCDRFCPLQSRVRKGLSLLVLSATALLITVLVRLCLLARGCRLGRTHRDAIGCLEEFLEQYPFHLYPLLCKSLELAYLKTHIKGLLTPETRVVELAIGDGSLSSRVFPPEVAHVGLDISPYSLKLSARMPHVKGAVICDCLNPPIRPGSFDLLVSNNFLHHVTDKERVLAAMAGIAKLVVFNENSPYWASAWPTPFLLGRLGFRNAAERHADGLAKHFLQDLRPQAEVEAMIRSHFRIVTSEGYLCEVTYFLCGIFSRLMGCYGPPMPSHLRTMCLNPRWRWLTLGLTRMVAKALIRFDAVQDKSRAVFISYTCESTDYQPTSGANHLICPDCRVELLPTNVCGQCGRAFDQVDQMRFVLPEDMQFIRRQYIPETKAYDGISSQQHH